jgi:PAS domain S-box-containing protein
MPVSESSESDYGPHLDLFQTAFDFAAIGMALVSPDGRWLRVNRSLCQIIGYAEAELLQGRFQDVTHADDLHLDLENVAKLLSGQITSYQMEKRYLHKSGSIVWGMLSVSLYKDSAGKPSFFISQIQTSPHAKQARKSCKPPRLRSNVCAKVFSRCALGQSA